MGPIARHDHIKRLSLYHVLINEDEATEVSEVLDVGELDEGQVGLQGHPARKNIEVKVQLSQVGQVGLVLLQELDEVLK